MNGPEKSRVRRISIWPHPSEPNRKLHAEIMRLVGEAVSQWASIEDLLAELLAQAANCPRHSALIIFYSLNSFSARLSTVKAAVQHCTPDTPDRLMTLNVLAKLRSLHTTRNNLIHASYSFTLGRDVSVMTRKIVRSERKQPVKIVKAQTGEIKTHLDLLYSASQFLAFWTVGDDEAKSRGRQWADIFLNTDSATSE